MPYYGSPPPEKFSIETVTTVDAEEIKSHAIKARQKILELNEILAALVEEGCDVLVEVENRIAKAEGYKMTKTPRIHLRILKEVE